MAINDNPDANERVIATCGSCGAVVGGELTRDGEIVPLGSSDECACGSRAFQILR